MSNAATTEQLDTFFASLEFERGIAHDDGAAAERHLNEGRAIYYGNPDPRTAGIIREFPDGKKAACKNCEWCRIGYSGTVGRRQSPSSDMAKAFPMLVA